MKYEIKYSKRKTLSLCIKNAELIVKAPLGTSKRIIDEIVNSKIEWINKGIEKQQKEAEKINSLTDDQILELRCLAKRVIPQKVLMYSKIMGLNFGRITITGAKTRFGSCSSKGNLSFSYHLMLYPEEAIDYVVVHELAHLKEMNHSKKFYEIVEFVLPDYKKRRKLLKNEKPSGFSFLIFKCV